jgi:anaerobic magnesium-protoporphyrin IX monomethyl ester cyclase
MFRPDCVGFSHMTGVHREILKVSSRIKTDCPRCKMLLGGIHPTLYPETINTPDVDFIYRGEGELPTVELLDALDTGVRC